MHDELLLTVFTPSYNRAHTLGRLYESLKAQNCGGFEWLIVDDGSADATEQAVSGFTGEGKFPVRYVYKENGGKHTALNRGIELARGRYFLCVDSDDCMEEGAMEQLFACLRQNPEGVIAYKTNLQTGQRIGPDFPAELERATLFSLINDHHCAGDRTLVYRTDLLRPIRIPEPAGCRFFPETWLYDRFDENYTCRLLRKDLCRCEYLPGGYSDSFRMLMIRNARSMKWFYAARLEMKATFRQRLGFAARYAAFALLAPGKEGRCRGKRLPLVLLGLPLGLPLGLFYGFLRWRAKEQ